MISTLGQMCSWNAAQTHQAWHPHMPQVSITRPILHNLFSEIIRGALYTVFGRCCHHYVFQDIQRRLKCGLACHKCGDT